MKTSYLKTSTEIIDSLRLVQMSFISRIELLSWPKANDHQLAILNRFIGLSEVLLLSEKIILKTVAIKRNYRVKLPDAIIAATLLLTIWLYLPATHVIEKIEGLTCVNYYA